MATSVNFDRIAHRYDATRGGEERGRRVAAALADRLPGERLIDASLAVHVLHLVGDPGAVLGELARVLRPGGRLAVVGGGELARPSDVGAVLRDLRADLDTARAREDRSGALPALAATHGLGLVEEFTFPREERGILSPREAADQVEARVWSHLWDLDDVMWARAVVPALDRLRALPDQERPRPGDRISTARLFARR
ncbi:methyltransferase domain-containing protein [Frankia sp. R82]|uniref:class I SAM-dependent methyltransferase n=1 Tax=Frankia sp. R82 TaxID=2950553 RepID=UPI00204460C3|nr:methyltransferase domain-containing protein [Frankia sp. R82]MCM3884584.1 class I SAM-dependent methyltransferase [Frankia sp. R82]